MKYATYTGLVTNSDGTQLSIREGELWQDDDVTVTEHPDMFTSTEPNSEVAGAFPMEHQLRSTEGKDGDAVEQKRWEGEHPRGYAIPGENPETGEPDDSATEEGDARELDAPKDTKRGMTTPKVERATRRPGETRKA